MKKFTITMLFILMLGFCMMGFAGCFGSSGRNDGDENVARKETIDGVEYTVYNGHYYLLVEEKLTWHEAEFACEERGGYLATITSYEEHNVVGDLSKRSIWLGATDENNEGTWQWVTGEEFVENYWKSEEPNGLTIENYVVGLYTSSYRWNDTNCNVHNDIGSYVCEWDRKEDIGKTKYRYKKSISTVNELKALSNKAGIYYLEADLDLSSEENWTPITNFKGLFIGQNHIIRNLTIDSLNVANLGLFYEVTGVKDLVLENIQISAVGNAGYVGALAGTSYGNIDNVTVSGIIDAPYYSYVGGVVGSSDGGTVKNCTSNIKISAKDCVGGIVGMAIIDTTGAIDDNENKREIKGSQYVGGIAGSVASPETEGNYTYAINNCTNSGAITVLEGRVGGIIGILSGFSDSYVEEIKGNWLIPNDDTYIAHEFKHAFTLENCKNNANITAPSDYTDAAGIIGHGVNVTLIKNCENIGDITGGICVGSIVGYSPNTNIKANNFVNQSRIQGTGRVGGFAGHAGLIENAINEGEIISTDLFIEEVRGAWVGGIAGYATGIISCENKSDIIVAHDGRYVGGVVGFVYQSGADWLRNVKNSGDVQGKVEVGGIAGNVTSSISGGNYTIANCENTGKVTSLEGECGGITGGVYGNTSYSLSTLKNLGEIIGNVERNYVGGIVGYGKCISDISVCENKGDVSGGFYIGGIAGDVQNATIRSTGIPNNANISGVAFVGGFAGTAKVVEDSINYGIISASGKSDKGWAALGGVVGKAEAVYRCENYANITYTGDGRMVGGIVGYLSYSTMYEICIDNKNHGDIVAINNHSIGGIVGHTEAAASKKIDGNINNGNVSADFSVGGIVGEMYHTYTNESNIITNCINNGVIEGNKYYGGIVGQQTGLNLDEYYMKTNTTAYGEKIGSDN